MSDEKQPAKPQGEKAPPPKEQDFRERIRIRPAPDAFERLGEACDDLKKTILEEFRPMLEPAVRFLARMMQGDRVPLEVRHDRTRNHYQGRKIGDQSRKRGHSTLTPLPYIRWLRRLMT